MRQLIFLSICKPVSLVPFNSPKFVSLKPFTGLMKLKVKLKELVGRYRLYSRLMRI